MRARETLRLAAIALIAPLAMALVAACGGDGGAESTATTAASPAATMDMSGGSEEYDFGHPAEASAATRTVDVEAADTLRFDPDAVQVEVGETVTFRVHNAGNIPHEFVLGTAHEQEHHEEEMQAMAGSGDMMHDEPNALAIAPGETKEITWTFTEAGTAEFGCHEPGHYAGGMKGTITAS